MSKKTTKMNKNVTATVKPSITKTAEPKVSEPKKKKVRQAVTVTGEPIPAVGEFPNPLLMNKRNKRALCVAFAHLTGGSQGTDEQDKLLIRAVRESGVLYKAGLNVENYESNKSYLTSAEQSGLGYAIRGGRNLHDDYMAQYPEKVAECLPFARAFLDLISKGDEVIEKERPTIKKAAGALFAKIRATEAAKPKKEKKDAPEVVKTKVVAKPKVSVMKTKATKPTMKPVEKAVEVSPVTE